MSQQARGGVHSQSSQQYRDGRGSTSRGPFQRGRGGWQQQQHGGQHGGQSDGAHSNGVGRVEIFCTELDNNDTELDIVVNSCEKNKI